MEPHSLFYIAVVIISLIAIAVLSMSESSFIAVNKYRLRGLIEKGDSRAKAAKKILDKYENFFSAVILSGNLFTVLATSIGTVLAVEYFGERSGLILATVLLTFLLVVLGELTPKTFGVTHSEQVSLFLAKPMQVYIRLVSPLIWIFSSIVRLFGVKKKPLSFLTAEEIKAMITIGEEEGAIEEEEKEMLHRVFEFGDKQVSEVMVPRTEIVTIPHDATIADARQLVSKEGYSRYPVIRESIDDIIGILYIKDIVIKTAEGSVKSDTPVSEIVRDSYFVPENKMVSELLDEMQKKKFHIAIVIDEYGGTDGLVTLEDIIEEIVGGLQDEFEAMEAEKDIEVLDERTFIVSGQTGIDEINELVGVEIGTADFNTIGGFVFGLFGRLPRLGEQVRFQNLRFLILEMEGRKVSKLKITKL